MLKEKFTTKYTENTISRVRFSNISGGPVRISDGLSPNMDEYFELVRFQSYKVKGGQRDRQQSASSSNCLDGQFAYHSHLYCTDPAAEYSHTRWIPFRSQCLHQRP